VGEHLSVDAMGQPKPDDVEFGQSSFEPGSVAGAQLDVGHFAEQVHGLRAEIEWFGDQNAMGHDVRSGCCGLGLTRRATDIAADIGRRAPSANAALRTLS